MTNQSRGVPALLLLQRLAEATISEYNHDRRERPERFIGSADGIGPDYLFVQNVAAMLGCNVDYVRRIPRHQLPASKVGLRLIYARADVETYIGSRRDSGTARHVAARAPRKLQLVATDHAVRGVLFDPVACAKRLLKES